MEKTLEKNNYNTVDFFKLIGSIMIFTMHGSAFSEFGDGISLCWELLTRWAVPFFFISSSFFLFKKSDLKNAGKIYIKRIFILYITWFIINIPNTFHLRLYGQNLLSVSMWLNFLADSLLSSTFIGSWFLASCLFSCIFVVYFCRKLSTKKILILTSFFQIICIFSSAWGGVDIPILKNICDLLRFPLNIFCGCFYFAIGKFFAENKEKIDNIKTKTSIALLVISFILYFIEIFVSKKFGFFSTTDQSFFVVPISVFAFLTALKIKIPYNWNFKLMRKASTIIYCAQGNLLIFKTFLISLIPKLVNVKYYLNIISFIIISVIMVFIIWLIIKLQSKFKIASILT